MEEIENTSQIETENKKERKPKKKFFERRSGWVIVSAFLMIIIFVIGSVSGAARGINDRLSLAETQAAPRIQSQLEGARKDIEEGRYEVAISRLDWILEEMAEFLTEEELAEVAEIYSQTLLLIASRKSPTPIPSPTPTPTVVVYTPTPDLRGAQEMFENIKTLIVSGSWDEAIQTITALREKDITFQAVQVDGFLFIALRNRGIQKILVEGSLEPGIFDLSMAERFAPLDSRAEGLRTWTRLYITGASFWDVDWSQVVFYMEQVYPHLPNLRDGTFMTATERFRIGAIEYATQLLAAGEYCLARDYFERALDISEDAVARQLFQDATEACEAGLLPPEQPPEEMLEPAPEEGEASPPQPPEEPGEDQAEQPPVEATPEPAEQPTETPPEENND